MSWLFGVEAAQKIDLLSKNLFNKIYQQHQKNHVVAVGDRFLPWMCDARGFENASFIFSNPRQKYKTVFDPRYLSMLSEIILNNSEHPICVALKDGRVRVYHDISYLRADAQLLFTNGQSLVAQCGQGLAQIFESLACVIIPIRPDLDETDESTASLSSHAALGALFLCIPKMHEHSCLDLTGSIAHELGHQVLMIYQRSDRILTTDFSIPTYSGTRKTDRPAVMAFHAAVALGYMLCCAKELAQNPNLSREARRYAFCQAVEKRQALRLTLESLWKTSAFTELGQSIFDELFQLCNASEFWLKSEDFSFLSSTVNGSGVSAMV